ncbi:hypothetical protein ALC60_12220 [Trachymyrmex zeteki]|uniref:Uncharacterized protein n=1 Tax=Mycetomoellerius zeteki TaxID=64791 RepID=A0A151WLH8_9HYME|nr:hypothetical protein ALC60_12220 [Trachymyrmex zeteki]
MARCRSSSMVGNARARNGCRRERRVGSGRSSRKEGGGIEEDYSDEVAKPEITNKTFTLKRAASRPGRTRLTVKVSELASRFILMATPMKVANTIVTRRLLHSNMHMKRKSEEDGGKFALRSNKWFVWE